MVYSQLQLSNMPSTGGSNLDHSAIRPALFIKLMLFYKRMIIQHLWYSLSFMSFFIFKKVFVYFPARRASQQAVQLSNIVYVKVLYLYLVTDLGGVHLYPWYLASHETPCRHHARDEGIGRDDTEIFSIFIQKVKMVRLRSGGTHWKIEELKQNENYFHDGAENWEIIWLLSNPFNLLTFLLLRLLLSRAQEHKYFWKTPKPYHVGIHWIALTEFSQMNTICQGFSQFLGFLIILYSQINHHQHKG